MATPPDELTPMQVVGFYTPNVGHYLESLIYYFLLQPCCRVLLIVDTSTTSRWATEHPWGMKRLQQCEGLEILESSATPEPLDRLFFEFPQRPSNPYRQSLAGWQRQAKERTLLCESYRYSSWKTFFKEYLYRFPAYFQANSLLLQDGPDTAHPFPFIQRVIRYPVNVHPQYLTGDVADDSSFFSPPPPPEQPRPYRFIFVGNYNPPERQQVLATIEAYLRSRDNSELLVAYEPGSRTIDGVARTIWRSYGDRDKVRGLPGDYYRLAHEEADFSLCPLGWGDNWTHRVVESALRGAIPILEDASRYNLGLEDEKNCIVVRDRNWLEAIQRANRKTLPDLVRMRRNLEPLREVLLPKNISTALAREPFS